MDEIQKAIKAVFDRIETPDFHKFFANYRLDKKHRVVQCSGYEAFQYAKEIKNRLVALTETPSGARVSTVFLGGFMVPKQHACRLFETMICGGPTDGWQQQYETWEQALRGHEEAVRLSE